MLGSLCLLSALALVSAQVTLPMAPIPSDSMHFLSLGDWGKVNSDQSNVAKQMSLYAAKFNASFLLAVGDNFYESGVQNSTDPQWQTTYRDVYTAESLQMPWLAIAGNHDHYGNAQAEVDYYNERRDSRWIFPSFWYTATFHLEQSNATAQFVFIDTIILADDNPAFNKSRIEQYKWIQKTLEASTADWLFVVGHYPVYSGGEHGNTNELINNLLPMMKKANVDMYLCGHDHTLQHMQESKKSILFFLSGNGAKRGSYTPIKQSLFGVVDPGFMTHSISGLDTMTTNMVDLKGKLVYTYTQTRIPKKNDKVLKNSARSLYDILTASE